MKKVFACLFTLLSLVLFTMSAWAGAPTDAVRTGLDKMIAIVHDPQYPEGDSLSDEQIDRLTHTVAEVFDYGELTKRAVGPAWRGFTPREREELTATFRTLLEKTYITKLEKNFLNELKAVNTASVHFNGEKIQAPHAMVFTSFQLKEKQLEVNFRLIDKKGRWMVYDIIGEGLTLLGVYKDDFRAALARMSPEEFMGELQKKIKDLDSGKAEGKSLPDAGAPLKAAEHTAVQPAAQEAGITL